MIFILSGIRIVGRDDIVAANHNAAAEISPHALRACISTLAT